MSVIKRINGRLTYVEREVVIPGTTMKITVKSYRCTGPDKQVVELASRKEAMAWIKANWPAKQARVKSVGKGAARKFSSAINSLEKVTKSLGTARSMKGVDMDMFRSILGMQERVNEIVKKLEDHISSLN